MKVDVYKNLNKSREMGKPIYSIRDPKTKRVICWTDKVFLSSVEFIVSKSGRNRVLREKRKNVHAFVRGSIRQPLTALFNFMSLTEISSSSNCSMGTVEPLLNTKPLCYVDSECEYINTDMIFHKDKTSDNFMVLIKSGEDWLTDSFIARQASYNPYKYDFFYDRVSQMELTKADIAFLDEDGLSYASHYAGPQMRNEGVNRV